MVILDTLMIFQDSSSVLYTAMQVVIIRSHVRLSTYLECYSELQQEMFLQKSCREILAEHT